MASEQETNIAFLGLGLMGTPMVRRLLQADVHVAIWNRSAEKAAALESLGARPAPSAAQAVAGARIICLCLTDASAVETVLSGPGGVLAGANEGALILDFSSLRVDDTRSFGVKAAGRGLGWVDAPVSGGPGAAERGRLVVFCGGQRADVERARPVLDAVSIQVTHMGELGAGQATKLCNQLIVSANLLAIAEAITLAQRLGVDAARLPAALKGGYADSSPLQIFGPRMAAPGPPAERLGAVATMAKDVEAVSAAASGAGLQLALYDAVRVAYRRAGEQKLSSEDLSQLVRLYASAEA